jgi:hypothetical protein
MVAGWSAWRMTIALLLGVASSSYPCTRTTPVSVVEMLAQADAIVRAKAVAVADDAKSAGPVEHSGGVRFDVLEVLKGDRQLSTLALPGRFVDRDDFNDHAAPYRSVRPSGRTGSCNSDEYRLRAEYLLVMQRTPDSIGWTTKWYALGPVNEQLTGPDDAWLRWVRANAK